MSQVPVTGLVDLNLYKFREAGLENFAVGDRCVRRKQDSRATQVISRAHAVQPPAKPVPARAAHSAAAEAQAARRE